MSRGENTAGSAAQTPSRARRVLLFLAIVWSIGGAFLALQAGMVALTEYSLTRWLPGEMGLPKQSRAAAAHCREMTKTLPRPAQDAARLRQAKYLAWRLGWLFGSAEGLLNRNAMTLPAKSAWTESSRLITAGLGIPVLELPKPGRALNTLRDFGVFLEEDPECVVAALASSYTGRHAALFKFASAVGFAADTRTAFPTIGPLLETQIQTYGRAASVPAELWQPLISESISVPPGGDARQGVQSIVGRIDAYLKKVD